ncbi:MAG: formylmethanofuran dehydrogenase subunit C [Candidatus Heimdallarchaeota archaeon]|nr:formylmethanofuran dehydrogenase subunit C [Candidatus Heimdallarchaeota archaeon]MBY8995344.1 formylmethanofuran dehydrogenase subunit C [Candidatus Heimdallarchaeota archaeon]
MTNINLTLKNSATKSNIPIEAEIITPDNFFNKDLAEIGQLSIWRGNKELTISQIFTISGDHKKSEDITNLKINLKGDLSKIKRIGQEMTDGSIEIIGSIGMHLGTHMSGGKIVVQNDVGDFAGANMEGGEIHILGNAGHYLGGSVRGDWRGMSNGKIRVEGNIGNECGVWMRKGIIEIGGNVNMFLGMHMHNGVIVVDGDVEERAGAEMTGGIIAIKGKLNKNLPSFEYVGKKEDLEIDNYGKIVGSFLEFKGDFAERKQGSMFLLEDKNTHLL